MTLFFEKVILISNQWEDIGFFVFGLAVTLLFVQFDEGWERKMLTPDMTAYVLYFPGLC